MYKITLLSAFEEDTIRAKIKELLALKPFSSFSPKYFLYSESSYESFHFELRSLSLFSSAPLYILEKVSLSSLEKVLSSLLSLSLSSPLILTTGYIKVADPIRNYLLSLPGISFLPLKRPPESYFSSTIIRIASSQGHKIENSLLAYLIFLYKDSFSSLEEDLLPFFLAMPVSTSCLTLNDFLKYRSTSSFEPAYALEQILKKNFLFLIPFEFLPASEIIPFLRFLIFSFISLLTSAKNSFFRVPSGWSEVDTFAVLHLLYTLEIKAKKNFFSSFNAFLSMLQIALQKQL